MLRKGGGRQNGAAKQIEWPTLALAAAIYGGWLAVTFFYASLPRWVTFVIGGWLLAWHNSLQHETIHGHPTQRDWINQAIGAVPLSLWIPYGVYCRSHRAHHASAEITDPFEDPESRYLSAGHEVGATLLMALERLQAPLIGRLVLGPLVTVVRFLADELVRLGSEPRRVLADWIPHLAACALVAAWLQMCGISLGAYVLFFVYPGLSLSLLRSFAEHRADHLPERRVAVVETGGPLGLLYLHNNLHAAHHEQPALPWYALPDFHRQHRERLLSANGGLLYRGYGALIRRYLFRPHDQLIHPAHAAATPQRRQE